MAQHFLLSPSARTLSLAKVARMNDDEARDAFQLVVETERCRCVNAIYRADDGKIYFVAMKTAPKTLKKEPSFPINLHYLLIFREQVIW